MAEDMVVVDSEEDVAVAEEVAAVTLAATMHHLAEAADGKKVAVVYGEVFSISLRLDTT